MLSIFDIFKIGVGPSSSHTNGPMIAGYQFTQLLGEDLAKVHRVQVDLYGSLSLTGRGHHTDRAVILGLLGNRPDTIRMTSANLALHQAINEGSFHSAVNVLSPSILPATFCFIATTCRYTKMA